MKYVLRDRETGNTDFDVFSDYKEALEELERFEEEDKENGDYTPDFYEIVEVDDDQERKGGHYEAI